MIKTCVVCGKQFNATGSVITCSPECRAIRKAKQTRQSQRRSAERETQFKSEWLTIPDAPNYEINARLQVRNKKTGRLLKPCFYPKNKTYHYYLYGTTGMINRTPQSLLVLARAALNNEEFLPIPSTNYRYEINKTGVARCVKSKRNLKQYKTSTGKIWYTMQTTSDRKKHTRRFADSLLAEVWGTENKKWRCPIPVILTKGNRRIYFESIGAASRFLATQYFFQVGTFASRLKKRWRIIEGWAVTYLCDDNNDYARKLNLEARRQKRVYDQTVEKQSAEIYAQN